MATPDRPSLDTYTLRDLEQVKILADPLRLRILRLFCEEPRTTKQVAALLEEKPTRLYHHVDALENAGLITLHHTRPNRGTLEKYYLAVARSFRADADLFAGDSVEEGTEWWAVGAGLLEDTAAELRRLGASGKTEEETIESATLMKVAIQATRQEIKEVQDRVATWVEEIQELSKENPPEDPEGAREEYTLALAFFPAPPANGE
jgi:DNA-binding transcriptional ArsR family regulator